MKKGLLIMSCLGLVLTTGCTHRVADLTVASTKNMNIKTGDLVSGSRVTGSDGVPVFLVPLGSINIKEAADRAIENDRCVVGLSDVVLNSFHIPFPIGYRSVDIEGTQVIDRSIDGCENWALTQGVELNKTSL